MNIAVSPFALSASPALAIEPANSELQELWRRRAELIRASSEGSRAVKAAEAMLPTWAYNGPCYINSSGERCGMVVGWPELNMENFQLPTVAHAFKCVRYSVTDLKKEYQRTCETLRFKPYENPQLRASYRTKIRSVIARIREQRAEEKKVGLPALYKRSDEVIEELLNVEGRIRQIADQCAFDGLAAVSMIERDYDCKYDRDGEVEEEGELGCVVRDVLQTIKPHLSGVVASDAERLLAAA